MEYAQIEQNVRPGEAIEQFALRDIPMQSHTGQIVRVIGRLLIKQAISTSQPMSRAAVAGNCDADFVRSRVVCRRQQLEPDGVEFQPPQPEHPLQRHGKIAAALAIFCGKAAAQKMVTRIKTRKTQSLNVQRARSRLGSRQCSVFAPFAAATHASSAN